MGQMEISLPDLEKDVHHALKSWYAPDTETSPFDRLQIFQQVRREADSDREATNKVLLHVLESLETKRQHDAELVRDYFLNGEKMRKIARSRNISEPSAYRQKDEIVKQLATILRAKEIQLRNAWQVKLETRLELPPATPLVGVEDHLQTLTDILTRPASPWIVCINGLGGIGKTALANAWVRQLWLLGQFHSVAWVNAKQQTFSPTSGMETTSGPALQTTLLIDTLLEQLDSPVSLSASPQHKKTALTELLKQAPHLIVIDNLETVRDYQTLLPTLLKLANPTKFLLTSRYGLRTQPGIFNLDLTELTEADTLSFLRQEIKTRGFSGLINASATQLGRIYSVVGGNPLALKLVVGQMAVLSLPQVLSGLKQAQDKTIEDLYNYIYWQAWHMLNEAAQKTLLIMPLAQGGTVEQLLTLTQLKSDEITQALRQLVELSLIQVAGTLDERRYKIHRLTETFLLNEALKWKTEAS